MRILRALAAAMATLLSLAASAAQAQQAAGTVKRVIGSGIIVSTAGPRPAQVGDSIFPGDRLVTGADSALGATLADGTLLSVGPLGVLTLQAFDYESTSRAGSVVLQAARGAFRMVSGLIAKANPRAIAIHTPTATIGVRGTDVLVDVGEDGQEKP